ncbi:MAG: aspartate 1-decarboxylase [Chloroflexi bacterium]|nr:aspartate 1-decarboxylase [Chloroflexota bacterium]
MRTMLAGKIHRATVTEANVDYEGSVTIDPVLMEAAGILPYELVHLLDLTNGARLETYAIEGERGSGELCVNGAAGLLVRDRDLVIILHYVTVSEEEACRLKPCIVRVDQKNRIVSTTDKIEAHAYY